MIVDGIDADDIETMAEILERELIAHRRKCHFCLALFGIGFVTLVVALVLVAVRLAVVAGSPLGAQGLGGQLALVQVVSPIAAMALGAFGAWWGAQNCLNTIERTLYAARNKRVKLFQTFLKEIQCAGKEKQRAWLEIIKSVIS
jgi:hypothetical protein